MDYDESSDILGGRLHVSPQSPSAWSDPGQITLLLGLGLAAFYTWARLAPHYRQWRETRYKKATRRRHGIPDDDNRPFNVAYAAALQAKKQRERKGASPYIPDQPRPSGQEEGMPAADALQPIVPSFVKSAPYANGCPPFNHNPETSQSTLGSRTDVSPVHSASQQEPTPQTLPPSLPNGSAARRPGTSTVNQPQVTRTSYGKHALDDETDSEPEMLVKKSRLEEEELMDGDEHADWHGSDDDMDVDDAQPVKRGSKRMASSEDDEGLDHSRTLRRDKRARKVSLDNSPESPDEGRGEDVDDGGEDVEDFVRGKKRDRMEAGSTFGGDDYITNDEGGKPKRRRRKGRVSNSLDAGLSRGQKRGRSSESHESDDSESEQPKQRTTRKKRGRRSQEDIIPLSNDPLCRGRPIGEEWVSHGVLFKVGPNGQRLRQELVRKSRSKFPMPKDSQHPDRRAHVDVYVETWLSEQEYVLAKERRELAWQDSSPTPPEPQTPGDVPASSPPTHIASAYNDIWVQESPSKIAGKSLLWMSTVASSERGPLKQSVATNAGSRLNIFPPPPAISTRRISSIYQAPASPATESPKLQKTKSYSKWEKQDLEAAAMLKIRDRQQAARAGEGAKASPSSVPTTILSAPASVATPSLFSPPSTSAASTKEPEKPSTSTGTATSFAPSSTSSAATTITTGLPKTTTTPAVTTTTTESSKPATTFSFAPSAPTSSTAATASTPASGPSASQTSSSTLNFFAKPAAVTSTNSIPATTSSSMPDFFAKRAGQTSTPTTNAATTPARASEAPKPASGFGVPPAQQPTIFTASPLGNATNEATKSAEQVKAPSGASLLSRIGMGPPPSSQPGATSTFSFAKPESTMPAAASTIDPSKASMPAVAAPVSGTPKFNFGVASKPGGASVTPAPTTNAVTFPSAPAPTSAPASTALKFGFGATNGSSQAAATSSTPAHGFGGSAAANNTTASSANQSLFAFGATSTPTSTSSAFGGASSGPSPFGAKPAEPTKSAFAFGGNPTTNSMSAANASPFGGSAAGAAAGKPGETPKSAFGGASSSSTNAPSLFGNTGQKADAQTAPKTIFGGFGTPSTAAPAFGATSAPTATGQDSKPTLGFGTPTSTTAAPAFGSTRSGGDNKPSFSFNFGQSSNATNSGSTSGAPAPAFGGFGSQPAAGSTPAISTPSAFGAPAANTQQSSSPFAFGAPSGGAFQFGSNSGQSQQK